MIQNGSKTRKCNYNTSNLSPVIFLRRSAWEEPGSSLGAGKEEPGVKKVRVKDI